MTKERLVKPIVHQHLDTIEDQIVVDAIVANMGKYHDKKGPAYDHETGSSEHHAMRCIAEACADVYEEGMDHEAVWRAAQDRCVDIAIGQGWNFVHQVREQGNGDEHTREVISRNVTAALYMFALDHQMKNLAPNDDPEDLTVSSDLLFDPGTPLIVKEIIAGEVRYMREHGIVADDGYHTPAPVADIIAERPRELRHEMWRSNMAIAYDTIPNENDKYAKYKRRDVIKHTQRALEAIAYEHDPSVLREPCEQTLEFVETYFGDDNDMAVAVLHSIPHEYVAGLYGQDTDAARQFESILQRVHDSGYDIEGNALWKLHKYLPGGLNSEAARSLPVVKEARVHHDDASFLAAALPEMPPLAYLEAAQSYNQHMREMMTDVCLALFPDAAFARRYVQDMARSFEPRLFVTDEATGYAAYENRDEYKIMQVIINRLNRRVKKYGAERFMELANMFDLGAIDVFSDRDIEVLDTLERGEPSEVATLRQQDVTLIMFDAYGDHNGATKKVADQLNIRDTNHERILVAWRHLPDFHKMLAMLRRYGIKPCTIAVANHGNPGMMTFNKGPESFQIVSDVSVAHSLPGVNHPYDMNYSQLATIARHFMSKPRYPSPRRQSQKRWILASCASDSAPEDDIPSIAEKGIRMINQSDISVIATEDYTTAAGDETPQGIYLVGNRAGEDRRNPRTSNMVELSVDPTAAWVTVKRKPVEARVTT